MRRWTLLGAWLVVLVLATTLTWQIVSAADSQVSDRPPPLNVAAPLITRLDSTTLPSPTTPQQTDPSMTTGSSSTTSTTTPSTSSSQAPTVTPTPTTTVSPWKTETVQTSAGTVVLSYRPGEVVYKTATPAPGFQVEVERAGPPTVKVEFESESSKVEVYAEWHDGEIDVEVSSESEDHD